MNACKAFCMLWTLKRHKEPTLVTVGDAIASFLENPDLQDQDQSFAKRPKPRTNFVHRILKWRPVELRTRQKQQGRVLQRPKRWYAAVSARRLAVTLSLCTYALGAGIALLLYGSSKISSLPGGETILSLGA